MLWLVGLFGAALVWTYPLALRLRYQRGRWQLAWLPRWFGFYGRARVLPAGKWLKRQDQERRRPKTKLPPGLIKDIGLKILGRLNVERLLLELRIGTASPFASSILAGACFAALGSLRGLAAATLHSFPRQPQLHLYADWAGGGLSGRLECIFHLKCGDIIVIIVYTLYKLAKGWRSNGQRA